MQKDNNVIFKGGKNGIVIIMDERASFKQIEASLRSKIRSASKFFADAKTTISFKGKELSESEIMSLVEIINTETDLYISFVEDMTGTFEANVLNKETKTDLTEEVINREKIVERLASQDTYFQKSGLRSGQAINHNGSIVILGDVNAGAEVVATGNVVVFGAVRGMVHAGSGGDKSAFVCALSMQPIQLRIADIITYFPKEIINENKHKIDPVYAFVQDEEIYVAPIAN